MLRASSVLLLSVMLGGSALAQTAPTAAPTARAAPSMGSSAPTGLSAQGGAVPANADPWEGTNRQLFAIFQAIDRAVLRPAAIGYTRIVPHPIRTGLHNAFSNLTEPVVFLNDALQARATDAGKTLGRFAMNSTVGLAGFLDPATPAGLAHHDNGFGNTLGRYGTPAGPYLFIPILGPSDVRDLLGSGLDVLSSPFTWLRYSAQWEVNAGRTVIGGLDTRANAEPQLKQVESMSTDTYATIRSLYLQNRQAEVSGGQVNVDALPDFGDQPAAAPADSPSQIPGSAAAATERPLEGPDATPAVGPGPRYSDPQSSSPRSSSPQGSSPQNSGPQSPEPDAPARPRV